MRYLANTLWGSTFFRLFLLALIVYNANLRSITSLDTNSTRYLPISILKEFDLDLNEFPFLHEYPAYAWEDEGFPKDWRPRPYWVQVVDGRYLSTFPVATAVLAVPFYAIPVLLGLADGAEGAIGLSRTEIVGTALSKLTASITVALSVGIVYLMCLGLAGRSGAVWIALIYAFATSTWSVTSQGLWQTSMSQPLLALALYVLVRAREDGAWAAYAGLPLALSVACRPPTLIFAALLAIYVAHRHPRQLPKFVIAPLLVGGLLLFHNLYFYGDVLGGYASFQTLSHFNPPGLEAFLGLLVSPSRGLFVLSPVLLFSLAGLGGAIYRRNNALLVYAGAATFLTVFFYSSWGAWHGNFGYSYRYLVDILPAMVLFLAAIWQSMTRHKWLMYLLIAVAGFSVLAQVVGAFFYPCGWYAFPVNASLQLERFWDWSDTEMLRCLRAGPVEPDGLRFLRAVLSK